jgi:hypothetical protein
MAKSFRLLKFYIMPALMLPERNSTARFDRGITSDAIIRLFYLVVNGNAFYYAPSRRQDIVFLRASCTRPHNRTGDGRIPRMARVSSRPGAGFESDRFSLSLTKLYSI